MVAKHVEETPCKHFYFIVVSPSHRFTVSDPLQALKNILIIVLWISQNLFDRRIDVEFFTVH